MNPTNYLNIDEQEKLLAKLVLTYNKQPLKDKFLYKKAEYIAAGFCLVPSLLAWKVCYKAFSFHKFGKARIAPFTVALLCPTFGPVLHTQVVSSKLYQAHRSENPWTYALRSFAAHQFFFFQNFLAVVGFSFLCAQRYGMIPVPDFFYRRVNHPYMKTFFADRFRPHFRTLAVVWVLTSIGMTALGAAEYLETKKILRKMGRQTLVLQEDKQV